MVASEVLIIGSGIAGATVALRLTRNPHRQITLITRTPDPRESNTRYAQGASSLAAQTIASRGV